MTNIIPHSQHLLGNASCVCGMFRISLTFRLNNVNFQPCQLVDRTLPCFLFVNIFAKRSVDLVIVSGCIKSNRALLGETVSSFLPYITHRLNGFHNVTASNHSSVRCVSINVLIIYEIVFTSETMYQRMAVSDQLPSIFNSKGVGLLVLQTHSRIYC